jgi:cytochrome bd-type quinol oxidase subunit 2
VQKAKARRYRWANVAVLVVSVYLLASSVWSTPEMVEQGVGSSVFDPRWLVIAYVGAGVAGLLAIAFALKRPGFGKALAAVAGVLILSAFLGMRTATPLALLSIGLSGLVLLGSAPFMGPMPTPEQEGKPR